MTAKFLREFLSCSIVSAVAEVCFCRSAGLRFQSIATADLRFRSIVKIGRNKGVAIIAVFVFFYVDDITLSVFSVADVNFDNFFTLFDFSLEIKRSEEHTSELQSH